MTILFLLRVDTSCIFCADWEHEQYYYIEHWIAVARGQRCNPPLIECLAKYIFYSCLAQLPLRRAVLGRIDLRWNVCALIVFILFPHQHYPVHSIFVNTLIIIIITRPRTSPSKFIYFYCVRYMGKADGVTMALNSIYFQSVQFVCLLE